MNEVMTCIIVDDEYGAISVMENYISKVPWLDLEGSFSDPLEALNHLGQKQTDLVFMDINMPDLNGLQLARLVRSTETSIIFCTAYSEHALESYEVDAVDYLLKPIPFDRFLTAVNKLKPNSRPTTSDSSSGIALNTLIFIKSGAHIHQIDSAQISLVKKDGHYIIFKINGRELLSRMTFAQLLELLPSDRFVQVHRSYVVALDKIEIIHKQFIQIEGKEIPIGDAYKEAFFSRVNYIGN